MAQMAHNKIWSARAREAFSRGFDLNSPEVRSASIVVNRNHVAAVKKEATDRVVEKTADKLAAAMLKVREQQSEQKVGASSDTSSESDALAAAILRARADKGK
jgi:hypothetical protein